MSYGEKLGEYRKLADAYFDTERYQDFCATSLARLDQLVLDWVTGPDFDQLLVRTVQSVYPEHEHDQFIAHLRGLLAPVGPRRERPPGRRLRRDESAIMRTYQGYGDRFISLSGGLSGP